MADGDAGFGFEVGGEPVDVCGLGEGVVFKAEVQRGCGACGEGDFGEESAIWRGYWCGGIGCHEAEMFGFAFDDGWAGFAVDGAWGIESVGIVDADFCPIRDVIFVGVGAASGEDLQGIDGDAAEVVGVIDEKLDLVVLSCLQPWAEHGEGAGGIGQDGDGFVSEVLAVDFQMEVVEFVFRTIID